MFLNIQILYYKNIYDSILMMIKLYIFSIINSNIFEMLFKSKLNEYFVCNINYLNHIYIIINIKNIIFIKIRF